MIPDSVSESVHHVFLNVSGRNLNCGVEKGARRLRPEDVVYQERWNVA